QRLQHLGGEAEAGDLVQGAVLLALAARGADRIVDIGVGHGSGSPIRTESERACQKAYAYVNVKFFRGKRPEVSKRPRNRGRHRTPDRAPAAAEPGHYR